MYRCTAECSHSLTVLANCFPELNLKIPAKSVYASHRGYWKDINNQRAFLESLATKLRICDHKDWYLVSSSQVAQHGGGGLLNHYKGSLLRALETVYPMHSWVTFPLTMVKHKYLVSKGHYSLFQYTQRVSGPHELLITVQDISWV